MHGKIPTHLVVRNIGVSVAKKKNGIFLAFGVKKETLFSLLFGVRVQREHWQPAEASILTVKVET